MVFKSIRWRLQVWHGTLLVCLVTGLLGTFYLYERSERLREIDARLGAVLTPMLPFLTPPPGEREPGPPDDFPDQPEGRRERPPRRRPPPSMEEFDNGSLYYIVWSSDYKILQKSANAPTIAYPIPQEGEREGDTIRNRGSFREIVHGGPDRATVVIGTSTAAMTAQLHRLAAELIAAGAALVVFGLAGGWWVAGRALRPIAEISNAAETIASGDRSKRINLHETESELGLLAGVLNRTFDRLEKSFEQQVRFTADASHELRTPVSVILTQTQLALSRERTAPEYRETLKICENAAERMRKLVNSLLELARVDSGEFELLREDCDLAGVARESLDLMTPLAQEKGATLQDSIEPVKIKADAMKLGQVLINLLNNAIQHNPTGVQVSLSVRRQNGEAVVRVSDNGAGIAKEALPHLFDRFFRVDAARSRSKGNSGLGLAISKAIVEAHGGTICVESQVGTGTEFVVMLPLG